MLSTAALPQCSTPFGIIGILTCAHLRCRCRPGECSTPFGIIGILTSAPHPIQNRLDHVLNAFRHHRNSHNNVELFGIFDGMCSTPFGIIGILTLRCVLPCLSDIGCSTPFGIIGILTLQAPGRGQRSRPVLNAFRHHRNSHRKRQNSAEKKRRGCSTPFGIIGILTHRVEVNQNRIECAQRLSASSEFSLSRDESDCGPDQVLNAFRHHRNSHPPHSVSLSAGCRCSTPFGIIGILTFSRRIRLWTRSSAQRLSASSEFSQ